MKLFILDDCLSQLEMYRLNFPDAMIFWQVPTFRAALRLNKPDILICDLVMPECDGWKIVEWVHELYPDVKVIIATSHEGSEQKALAEMKGYGFWFKSKDYNTLRTLVAGTWKTSKD